MQTKANVFASPYAKAEQQQCFAEESFVGSVAEREIQVVTEFFAENPDLVAPVQAVLKQYGCRSYPRIENDMPVYNRRVIKDLRAAAQAAADQGEDAMVDDDERAPFMVCDLARPIIQFAKFKKNLPRVQPFYAMKCNPSEELLAVLSALGAGFDCASKEEFSTILQGGYAPADQIIFANPQKMHSHIRAAELAGIRWVTFDSVKEIEKLATHMPSCQAVLRIATDDSAAVCQFSSKFGAKMHQTYELLETAKKNGVTVVGVSFHVGSGNNDPNAYIGAIKNARKVFDQASRLGFEMKLLDLGGGLPGSEPKIDANGKAAYLSFEEICSHIRPLLDELFESATIIAEPGRFFAESTYSLAFNVHGAREVNHEDGNQERQYYVSDGLYGCFNCVMYDHAHPELHLLEPDGEATINLKNTTIWGPTCDSADVLLRQRPYPELEIGDWLFVPLFGAYTSAAGSKFNGYYVKDRKFTSSIPLCGSSTPHVMPSPASLNCLDK